MSEATFHKKIPCTMLLDFLVHDRAIDFTKAKNVLDNVKNNIKSLKFPQTKFVFSSLTVQKDKKSIISTRYIC